MSTTIPQLQEAHRRAVALLTHLTDDMPDVPTATLDRAIAIEMDLSRAIREAIANRDRADDLRMQRAEDAVRDAIDDRLTARDWREQ